jgi:hypothetical protein
MSQSDPKPSLGGSKSRSAACYPFGQEAREEPSSEPARLRHVPRRRGGSVAARGARAAASDDAEAVVLDLVQPRPATVKTRMFYARRRFDL